MGGKNWDQGHERVAFPVVTYAMFLVSIVAINVLVGLTVDDIRNFLENADLRKLTMRLKFILEKEQLARKSGENKKLDDRIKKERNLEASVTSDLISTTRIWEKIEKKQEEIQKRGEAEEEMRSIKALISDQTGKLECKIRSE